MDPITRAERAGQAHNDRLLNDYLSDDYTECPECGQETLETTDGKERLGWWTHSLCHNSDCDYRFEDADFWELPD